MGVAMRARQAWWCSVGTDLVRLLVFLLGPADIGPLAPVPPARAALPVASTARHITVIRVR